MNEIKKDPFEEYIRQVEPGKKNRLLKQENRTLRFQNQ